MTWSSCYAHFSEVNLTDWFRDRHYQKLDIWKYHQTVLTRRTVSTRKMGTRQIRIIIGIYCSHPAQICGFIHYDVLNMTVFVVLRSYVLNLNVLYSCLLICVSDVLNVSYVSCVSVSWLRTSYMCVDSFPAGSFMFFSLHTEVHFNTIWLPCVREWNNLPCLPWYSLALECEAGLTLFWYINVFTFPHPRRPRGR